MNSNAHDTYNNCLDRFRASMAGARRILIAAHDYPDPDCLSSALGIQHLLTWWGMPRPTIAYGGFVGRLENRALVHHCDIRATTFSSLNLERFDRTVLVDAFPGHGNVSLPMGHRISAVIDHHPTGARGDDRGYFCDVRPRIAATATIVTRYLQAAQCPMTPRLATALFYGIKTDTNSLRLRVSPDDIEAYHFTFDRMLPPLLAIIEDPPRPAGYFAMLHDALENAVRFGRVGYAHLRRIEAPDQVAEMADFTMRHEDIDWMICSGIIDESLYFSVRAKQAYRAGPAAERIAFRLGGSGGGHTKRAAGRIPLDGRLPARLLRDFSGVFRTVLKVGVVRPSSILRTPRGRVRGSSHNVHRARNV